MRALLALLLVASGAHAALPEARVIDGDTINVPMSAIAGMPGRVSVRLIGVNTPETRGACPKEIAAAQAAKVYVRDVLARASSVTVTYVRWDKYGGRVDGRITVDGRDLGEMLVADGYAVPYNGGRRANVWCP